MPDKKLKCLNLCYPLNQSLTFNTTQLTALFLCEMYNKHSLKMRKFSFLLVSVILKSHLFAQQLRKAISLCDYREGRELVSANYTSGASKC